MNYCMIEVAFGNKEEAKQVIDELLSKKLVASCQVVESKSYWNWNKKKENGKEYLVVMKTKRDLAEEVYDVVKSIHSYECFEFAIFDLTSCNTDYLNWIEKETK